MNDDQCQKIPLRSRLAHGVWRTLLNSPAGSWVEQALVWSGHLSPHQSWPGQGAAVGEISRMRAGQSLIATLVGGVQIVVPAIPEGVALYIKGRYVEEGTVQLFHRFWKPGQVFFDVGANMGLFTFLGAKACGSTGQVYAFEPQVNLVRYLERSVALNECGHTVTIVGAAVSSDHSTHATLYYAANREGTGIPSLLAHDWLDQTSGMRVPTVSIDGYRRDQGVDRIDAMKIDVEGAEMLVLRGMRETLQATPPDLLVLEVLPERLSFQGIALGAHLKHAPTAATPGGVARFLAAYGYEPRRIGQDGQLGPTYDNAALQSINGSTNVGFVLPGLTTTRPEIFALDK
jgi:FkbM family methyltransferase